MDFIDYYAVLNVRLTAREEEVQRAFEALMAQLLQSPNPDLFSHAVTGYATLTNPYRRARYDKERGFLLVLQITPEPYLSAVCRLIHSVQPFITLQALIEKFKIWCAEKYDVYGEEALSAGYSYHLHTEDQKSYLQLRFPEENIRENFIAYLAEQRLVKSEE
jgi:curved DNA-binding protein CbpA